ncbi:hypothetical protein EIN_212160, partial [Entamoeba invadens IP1]
DGEKPKKYTKKDKLYSFKIYSNENSEWVCGTHCGFYIGSVRNSFISNKMDMFYDNVENVDEIVGTHFPSTFSVEHIVALQWA